MKVVFHSENIHPYCQPGAVPKTEGNGTFPFLKGLSTEQKIRVQTKSAARVVPVKYLTQYIEAKFDRFFSMTGSQRGCGVCVIGDSQMPSGCDPR